mgnify:CR=1 FL=1
MYSEGKCGTINAEYRKASEKLLIAVRVMIEKKETGYEKNSAEKLCKTDCNNGA